MGMSGAGLLIVGGGTGGHISPGIALYEVFKEKGVDVYLLAGNNDRRFSSIADVESEDLHLYGAPSFTRNVLKMPIFVTRFILSILRALRILKKLSIDGVISMGGYVSAPAIIAAIVAGIPFYLCEQNSIPGRVTRFFSKRARIVFTTFSVARNYFSDSVRIEHAGNPIRRKVFTDVGREEARRHFNLGHCKKVILAIGGSQGALTINELIFGLKNKFPAEFKDVGLIWSTGEFSYSDYKRKIQNGAEGGSVFLSPFIDDIGLAYRASDLAISRAGAGVMMELAAAGLPSILIPYPYAAMDHQDMNADEFVRAGAAVKFSNENALPEKVGMELFDLLNNRMQLSRMARNLAAVSRRNASRDIAEKIIADVEVR
jgi:UDP-N-acetylglucosamine--N-acetylmuramyl-(pentapeptide) pyrophosphoryl-undecaprenol N-acetylglucosamine transferase